MHACHADTYVTIQNRQQLQQVLQACQEQSGVCLHIFQSFEGHKSKPLPFYRQGYARLEDREDYYFRSPHHCHLLKKIDFKIKFLLCARLAVGTFDCNK